MGVLWILLAVLILSIAGWEVAMHGFRQPPGWPRILAASIVAWSWATLGLQVLGTAGLLNRVALFVWAGSGLAFAGILRWKFPHNDIPEKHPNDPWDLPATICVGLGLWVFIIFLGPGILLPSKVVSDGPIYHLYFAAKWWKAGRIFLVATPFGETAAPYFPANGDLFFSGLMTLYGGDRLARVGQLPFLFLTAATTYALAKKLGARSSSSAIATVWVVTSLPLFLFSFEANVDTIFVAGYLLTAYFGLQALQNEGKSSSLILSGLAAGASWGTKTTAMVFIPPLLGLIAVGISWRATNGRDRLWKVAILGISSLVLSGFWFARNFWITGNPLYPLQVRIFGKIIRKGWFEPSAMALSQFYLPINDTEALASTLTSVFDPRLLPFWIAGLVGIWAIGRPKLPRNGWIWVFSALAVGNIIAFWVFIPYRTQQRFMLQGLALAAIPLACLLDRGRWLRWIAVVLMLVHLLTPQYWPLGTPDDPTHRRRIPTPSAPINVPLSAKAWQIVWDKPGALGFQATQIALLLGGLIVAASWKMLTTQSSSFRKQLAITLTMAVPATYLVFMNSTIPIGGGMSGLIYPPDFPDYSLGWQTLERISPPSGTRVAYAGTNLPFFLMAGRLRNEVSYVNIDAHPDWLLHDYHLSAPLRDDPPVWDTPRPGWDRIHPDYAAWIDNLHLRKIRLLVVARANPQDGLFNIHDSDFFPIERAWAEEHPQDFERVYPRERYDPQFWIYRVR